MNAITLAEFGKFPVDRQAQHLWDWGHYLLNRQGPRITIKLYALENFYVEVWYNRQYRSITAITCFKKINKLDAYLNAVSLAALS